MALLERERSGEGQWISTSLIEAQIFLLDFQAARWTMSQDLPKQVGNNHPTGVPTGAFKSSDGFVTLAPMPAMWAKFCDALGAEGLAEDPKFAVPDKRRENREELNGIVEGYTVKKTTGEWVDLMNDVGVPCGPIYTLEETFDDPQVKHIGDRPNGGIGGLGADHDHRPTAASEPHAEQAGERGTGIRRTYGRNSRRNGLHRRSGQITSGAGSRLTAQERKQSWIPVTTESEKIVAKKDGGIGWLYYNNPERHNAISLDMASAAKAVIDQYAARRRCAGHRAARYGRQGVRLGRGYFRI